MERLPAEMVEMVVLEAAVVRWATTANADITRVLDELADVSELWSVIVGGTVFLQQLSARLEQLVHADPALRFRKDRAACSTMQTIGCTWRTRIASVADHLYVVHDTRCGRGLMRHGQLEIIEYDVSRRLDPPADDPDAAFRSVTIADPRNDVAVPVQSAAHAPPAWSTGRSCHPSMLEEEEDGVRDQLQQSVASDVIRTLLMTSDVAIHSELVDGMEVCERTRAIYLLLIPYYAATARYGLANISIVDAVSGTLRQKWEFPWSPPQLHSEHNVSISVNSATGDVIVANRRQEMFVVYTSDGYELQRLQMSALSMSAHCSRFGVRPLIDGRLLVTETVVEESGDGSCHAQLQLKIVKRDTTTADWQVDVVRRLTTALDVAVLVHASGWVVVAGGRTIDVLDGSLGHRRHIVLPSGVPDVNATSVLDEATGDLYFYRGLSRVYRAEIGREYRL